MSRESAKFFEKNFSRLKFCYNLTVFVYKNSYSVDFGTTIRQAEFGLPFSFTFRYDILAICSLKSSSAVAYLSIRRG